MRFLTVFCCSVLTLTAAPSSPGLTYAAPHDELAHSSFHNQYGNDGSEQVHHLKTHSEQEDRILLIFQRTQAAIRLRNFPIATTIRMAPAPHASAFVYNRRSILLSESLVTLLRSEDQLAFAISHEMAHIALGHTAKSGSREELAADAFAVAILAELGMDPCASTFALETLKEREPLYREPLSQRQEYLQKTLLSRCH